MNSSLRIAVTGLAATYPFGGVFWDYLQYALGLHRMGHDVLYIEDTGQWCYDPTQGTFVEDGQANATLLNQGIQKLCPDLGSRWFFRDPGGKTFGRSWEEVKQFCKSADLFIHISASCCMREEYFAARRVAFIDSDPMYTQASVPGYLAGTIDDEARQRVDMLRQHDVFFTFGENINAPDCMVPRDLFDWIPTRQPIVLDCFRGTSAPAASRRRVLTTVASWEPNLDEGPLVNGRRYKGKSIEFLRFINLPTQSVLPLEVALSGAAPVDQLKAAGWDIRNGLEVSSDPWIYQDYLAHSLGEWSVAKNAYVASRSGWFSCRSACYLALGVPVIVQDTAFAEDIPRREGVLAFQTQEEAVQAIDEVARDPQKHARRAQDVAAQCFDSRKVLSRLLDRALAASTSGGVSG